MDTRPIGVFDSGLGGLTALRELARLMPEEDLVYFGDTGRVPYGNRSKDILVKYARQDMAFLRTFNPKAVVVACGTVSTTALDVLRAENDIPVFGVVEPAAQAAAHVTRNGRVGLIGTRASIRSGAYERTLDALRPGVEVTARACPLLVPLVENGRFRPGDPVVETVVGEYLAPIQAAGVDALILGCTHYPLIRSTLGRIMGDRVALVNPAYETAMELRRLLASHDLLCQTPPALGSNRYQFYVSDKADKFIRFANSIIKYGILSAKTVNIEAY